jgi:eukaryotic-like serine/threonine-protein kinase
MLEFSCPICQARLQLDETWAGKKCRCSQCGQVLAVPALAGAISSGGSAQKRTDTDKPPSSPAGSALADMPTLAPGGTGVEQPGSGKAMPNTKANTLDLYFLAPAKEPGEIGRLGNYRVLKVLGAGGMGVVFQAEDLRLKRMVALKVMLPLLAASPVNKKRFLQEAEAAAALEHDHIVTIYQIDEDRGIPFIAMQLLRGESLEDYLQRFQRLEAAEVLRIGREIADGLAAAHERGLIHRDIKPSNIWLESISAREPSGTKTQRSRVKILDFGLARSLTADANMTKSGAILGTPAYMAPEQSRGKGLDGRCDLFSLGCVLYRMCTGQQAFEGADTIATLMAVASHDPVPPHQVNRRVPPALSRLIMDLLAKDPQKRPASARMVINRIQVIEDAGTDIVQYRQHHKDAVLPTPSITSNTIQLEPEPVRRSAMLVASLVGGAAVFLIGLVFFAIALFSNRNGVESDNSTSQKQPQVVVNSSKIFVDGPRRFLTNLKEFDVIAGQWPVKKGDCGDGHPIKVHGILSPHGLGMHPPVNPAYASAKYHLYKEADLFKATVAINDTTNWCWSPATFTVLGDGKELWQSKQIAHNHARSQECQVLMRGVDVLELRVQCVNLNQGLHAVWVEPRVLQHLDTPDE